jgi:hypothetical protein
MDFSEGRAVRDLLTRFFRSASGDEVRFLVHLLQTEKQDEYLRGITQR